MSGLLKFNIAMEINNCQNIEDIERVKEKYNKAFTNACDATEFNRMIKEVSMSFKE